MREVPPFVATALTDNELTYSIIKQAFPHVRDRMREIADDGLRFASEVDLVIGALRLARLQQEREKNETLRVPRPSPAFASSLQRDEEAGVRARFLKLLPEHGGDFPLKILLRRLRDMLAGQADSRHGLPAMLIARMPREGVDMLLLMADITKGEDEVLAKDLQSFALHIFLVVTKEDKAADRLFEAASTPAWTATEADLAKWREELQKDGYAFSLPTQQEIDIMRAAVEARRTCNRDGARLLGWAERFTEADKEAHDPGGWLRHFTWMGERNKRALMWLQRDYLRKKVGHFDPLSIRDEDLPLDLDHIVPQSRFGYDWRHRDKYLSSDLTVDELQSFRDHRHLIGNALGNFRWLDASDNRARGDGQLEDSATMAGDHYIDDPTGWNALIPDEKIWSWSRNDVAEFQARIDLRTLPLCQTLISDLPA
ncbi:hypothetical protein [uncultured Jannaschia sp.]|uniref:hypothetical protein n=1 Tax=uncultured Jannaschia sp. TaxID=293347 RepID=UPI002634B86E|nr:hypothetical protein [uncultured Jannaschia sp.]